jgi:hypothetical protein
MHTFPSRACCIFVLCLAQAFFPSRSAGQALPAPSVPLASPPTEEEDVKDSDDIQDKDGARSVDATPGDPWGDAGALGLISLRAFLQVRYTTTLAEKSRSSRESQRVREDYLAQQGDGFRIQRAMLRISSDPVKYLGFRMVLDFAQLIDNDPEDVVKQAYTRLLPIPNHLEFTVGLFKVPFSILELDPTNRHEFADFGPANQLLGNLGFAGRDLGVQAMVAPLRKAKRLRLYAGAFRTHSYDENDLPVGSLAGRIEALPHKTLRLGAGIVEHMQSVTYNRPFNTSSKDYLPNPPDPLFPAQKRWDRGRALGIDARFKMKGFMLRGEYVYGDRVDVDQRYDARTFWAAWGILSYRVKLPNVQLLPAARAEWLDSDRENKGGMYRTLSLSLSALLLERVRLLFDATHISVEDDTALLKQPKPLQEKPYVALDQTRLTVQLQLEL